MSRQNFEKRSFCDEGRLYVGFHTIWRLRKTIFVYLVDREELRAACVRMFVRFNYSFAFGILHFEAIGQAVNLLCVLISYLWIDKISCYYLLTADVMNNKEFCIEAAFRKEKSSQHRWIDVQRKEIWNTMWSRRHFKWQMDVGHLVRVRVSGAVLATTDGSHLLISILFF